MPVPLPLGGVPADERGGEVPHIARSRRLLAAYAVITDGKTADITVARTLQLAKGSLIVVMDCGYCDYALKVQLWTALLILILIPVVNTHATSYNARLKH